MSTEERVLTGARWSAVCRTGCARVGVYGHQHAEPDEIPDYKREELDRYFQRGLDIEQAHLDRLGIPHERQVPVAWPIRPDFQPFAVGHADAYVPDEGAILEYTSTQGAELSEGKALQAAGYALNHPEAFRATVVSIDPHSYLQRAYPIDVTGLEPRVRELEDGVIAGVIHDEMPPRVCATPSDGYHRGCPFVGTCFDGWEPTPIDELIGLDEKLEQLATLEDVVAERKQALVAASDQREQVRAELRDVLAPGEQYKTPKSRILVKRSVWRQDGSFSLSSALKAGHTLPADLLPFIGPGGERERWTIKRLDSEGRAE